MWRGFRLVLIFLLLGAAVWLGLKEGVDGWTDSGTIAQRVASSAQLLYGGAAAASLWAIVRRAAWARRALLIWGAAVTATATLAPVVWGGSGWLSGAVAGLATAAIAALMIRGALAHLRERSTHVLARGGEAT